MAHLEISRFIPTPPEAVWDVLADLERQGDWMADVHELAIVSEQKRGAGTILGVTSKIFGRPIVRDVMEIIAWDPPHGMDVLHRTPPVRFGEVALHGTGSFILEPVTNGTILTWVEDFRPPLGPLGEIGFALVVRPHLTRVFARSMDNLRGLAIERAAAAARSGPVP